MARAPPSSVWLLLPRGQFAFRSRLGSPGEPLPTPRASRASRPQPSSCASREDGRTVSSHSPRVAFEPLPRDVGDQVHTGISRSFTCMRARSLQSCPTLCDRMDCSPPGSSVLGILQARILGWVACPPPGHLYDSGMEPAALKSPALAGGVFTTGPPGRPFKSLSRHQS